MAESGRKKRGKEAADERILVALSCGASAATAAREAGVSTRTVERRLADPAFKLRLSQLRGQALERAGGALCAASLRAVQTLLSLQESNQPAAIRLGAAKAILELSLKVRELLDIENRLSALEARLAEDQGH